tara:strand:- start:807 stop:1070 length:264 start_codon:yes stop_codon:yes gene_type:complete
MNRCYRVGRPKGDSKGIDPAIGIFLKFLDHNQDSDRSIEQRAGLARGTISRYRRGVVSPSLMSFRALLNTVGFDLAIVKASKQNEQD